MSRSASVRPQRFSLTGSGPAITECCGQLEFCGHFDIGQVGVSIALQELEGPIHALLDWIAMSSAICTHRKIAGIDFGVWCVNVLVL